MQLSEAGKIAHRCWEEIPLHFPNTALDEFIIMPDHMHGIIVIVKDDDNQSRRGLIKPRQMIFPQINFRQKPIGY